MAIEQTLSEEEKNNPERIIFRDCDCCWRGNHRDCPHGSHEEIECKCDLKERF